MGSNGVSLLWQVHFGSLALWSWCVCVSQWAIAFVGQVPFCALCGCISIRNVREFTRGANVMNTSY